VKKEYLSIVAIILLIASILAPATYATAQSGEPIPVAENVNTLRQQPSINVERIQQLASELEPVIDKLDSRILDQRIC